MVAWAYVFLSLCLDDTGISALTLGISDYKPTSDVAILSDLIYQQEVTNNIALVIPQHDPHILYLHRPNKSLTFTVISSEEANADALGRLQPESNRYNLQMLYIFLHPYADAIYGLIKSIKQADSQVKVAVIYKAKIDVKRVFAALATNNIYIFNPSSGTEEATTYSQYEVCQFCNQGVDVVMLTNTWRPGVGFKHTVRLDDSFKGNFYGATLKMGTLNLKPNIYVTGIDEEGNMIRDGIMYSNYVVLGAMLNVKWDFVHASISNQFKLTTTNNSAAGLLKDLVTGKVDIVGGGWTGLYRRYRHVDFSATTNYMPGFSIISMEPSKELEWFALVLPFPWYTWILIVLCVPAVGITAYVAMRYNRSSDKCYGATLNECIWEATIVICWESIKIPNPPWPSYFLYSLYLLACMILINLYMSEYTSILVTPSYIEPPVDSFDQLFNKTDRTVLTISGNWYKIYLNYFKNVKDVENRIEKLSNVYQNPWLESLKMIQKHPHKYVMIDYPGVVNYEAVYFAKNAKRRFHYSKETFPDKYYYLFFSKNFQFKEIFNKKITLLQDMGFMGFHEYRLGGPAKMMAIDKLNKIEENEELLRLKQFMGPLLLLLSGHLMSIIGYLAEVTWRRRQSH